MEHESPPGYAYLAPEQIKARCLIPNPTPKLTAKLRRQTNTCERCGKRPPDRGYTLCESCRAIELCRTACQFATRKAFEKAAEAAPAAKGVGGLYAAGWSEGITAYAAAIRALAKAEEQTDGG